LRSIVIGLIELKNVIKNIYLQTGIEDYLLVVISDCGVIVRGEFWTRRFPEDDGHRVLFLLATHKLNPDGNIACRPYSRVQIFSSFNRNNLHKKKDEEK